VIRLDGIVKRYDEVTALDGATLDVARGTVHAVLGENGAGKTTLMRVAFGMVRPDAGTITVEGVVRRFTSPAAAIAAGIGMVHQHYALVGAMSVAENVALGTPGWRYDRAQAEGRVEAAGAETGLKLHPDARVDTLSVGEQQRVEILKALARAARILILDEPTAVLDPAATRELLAWLRRYADRGGTVVLVTHKLREALSIADAVTVLRAGRSVLTTATAADRGHPSRLAAREVELATAMLGTADAPTPAARTPARTPARTAAHADAAPIVRARHIDLVDARGVAKIIGATFSVRAGEIVGVAAAEGAGHRELLRTLAGRAMIARGVLELPAPAAIGYVPEDRHRDGLVLDFSLTENVALRGAGHRRGRIRWRTLRDETAALIAAFDVRAARIGMPVRALSGGNQQKLVLARELGDGVARLLVVDNPTRGLDLLAAADVHRRLVAAREAGTAVVFYSSDLDEVIALSDRIVVIAQGTLRDIDPPFDRDAVGRRMLGMSA
jgi:general nucleoside transport system ATP-binding protein